MNVSLADQLAQIYFEIRTKKAIKIRCCIDKKMQSFEYL